MYLFVLYGFQAMENYFCIVMFILVDAGLELAPAANAAAEK
jgi:hypothetical protein